MVYAGYILPLTTIGLIISLYLLTFPKDFQTPKLKFTDIDENQLISKWKPYYKSIDKENTKSLNMSNISVVATALGYKNIAMVYINNDKKIVKEGDNLPAGIKVLRINKDSVEFLVNGQKQKIKLGQKMEKEKDINIPTGNLPPLENILSPNKNSNVIPKSELEKLTSDPGIMFTQIRLVPVVEGGQTKGFRFDWIADGSLFQRMGLNVGDILVSINNQPINSGEDAFRILQIIRNEKSFKIAIIRNGQPVELSYTVD